MYDSVRCMYCAQDPYDSEHATSDCVYAMAYRLYGSVDSQSVLKAMDRKVYLKLGAKIPNYLRTSDETQIKNTDLVDRFKKYVQCWELTITQSPDRGHDVSAMLSFLNKIAESKMYKVDDYFACIELTKEGIPHIHAILGSSLKTWDISKMRPWYDQRFECKRVRELPYYCDYIMKEANNNDVMEFCRQYNIDQFIDAKTPKLS